MRFHKWSSTVLLSQLFKVASTSYLTTPPPKKKKSIPTFLGVFNKTITSHFSSFHQAVPTKQKVKENIDLMERFFKLNKSTFASTVQSTTSTIAHTLRTKLFMVRGQEVRIH